MLGRAAESPAAHVIVLDHPPVHAYQTLHARRCAYRRGKVPPGLFLPSTVPDYAHWHGD